MNIILNLLLLGFVGTCLTIAFIGIRRGWKLDNESIEIIENMTPEELEEFKRLIR